MNAEEMQVEAMIEEIRNNLFNYQVDRRVEDQLILEAYDHAIKLAVVTGEVSGDATIMFYNKPTSIPDALRYIKKHLKPVRSKRTKSRLPSIQGSYTL